jgi:hypothetical protein
MAVPSSGQLKLNGDINLEINGTGTGTDVSLITLSIAAGLTAPHAITEFYGYVDALAPSVYTSSATSVTATSMIANGGVSSDNGATITSRGFYFGTSSSYASNAKYTVSGTTGAFNNTFSSISSSTTYYITSFAINSVGETVGTTVSQATPANLNLGRTTKCVTPFTTRNLYYETPGSWTYAGSPGNICIGLSRSYRHHATSAGQNFSVRQDSNGCQAGNAYTITPVSGYKEEFPGQATVFWSSEVAVFWASGG